MERSYVEEEISISINETKLASQIHKYAQVLSTKYNDDHMILRFRSNKVNADKIIKLLQSSGKSANSVERKLSIHNQPKQ